MATEHFDGNHQEPQGGPKLFKTQITETPKHPEQKRFWRKGSNKSGIPLDFKMLN